MAEPAAYHAITGLARLRVALLTLALPLVVLSGAVLGVAALLPWRRPSWAGSGRLAPGVIAVLLAAAVLAVALPVWSAARRRAVPGAGAALAGLAVTVLALLFAQSGMRRVQAPDGIAAAGPVSVAVLATLLAGWALVLLADRLDRLGRKPRTNWRYLTAAVLVLAVLAAGVVQFVGWWRSGRLIDHSTAAAPRPAAAALPQRLGTRRWSVAVAGDELAGVVGGDAVVREDTGVSVLDATTGAQRWHYRYAQRYATTVTPSADGTVLVVGYGGDALVGLDRATGRQRWWRDWPAGLPDGVDVASGADALVLNGGTQLAAVSVRTGAVRWQAHAADLGRRCEFSGLAVTGAVAVTLLACAATAYLRVEVVGLDLATGRQVWRQQPAAWQQGQVQASEYSLTAGSAGRVLATSAQPAPDGQSLLLDAATGRTLVTLPRGTLGGVAVLDDTVHLFGDKDEAVYRFSASSGAPEGSWATPVPVSGREVTVVGDTMMVVGHLSGHPATGVFRIGPDGSTVDSYQLPLAEPGCTGCAEAPGGLGVGPGVLVVATRFAAPGADRDSAHAPPPRLRLTALG